MVSLCFGSIQKWFLWSPVWLGASIPGLLTVFCCVLPSMALAFFCLASYKLVYPGIFKKQASSSVIWPSSFQALEFSAGQTATEAARWTDEGGDLVETLHTNLISSLRGNSCRTNWRNKKFTNMASGDLDQDGYKFWICHTEVFGDCYNTPASYFICVHSPPC